MNAILKRMVAGVLGIFVLVIWVSSFRIASSARVTGENGTAVAYRAYRSVAGQVYIEDAAGVPLIIYPRKGTVTYPDGDVAVLHTRSWFILDPIRSILPVDPPLTLGFEPRLEIEEKSITLNVTSAKRITIRF